MSPQAARRQTYRGSGSLYTAPRLRFGAERRRCAPNAQSSCSSKCRLGSSERTATAWDTRLPGSTLEGKELDTLGASGRAEAAFWGSMAGRAEWP